MTVTMELAPKQCSQLRIALRDRLQSLKDASIVYEFANDFDYWHDRVTEIQALLDTVEKATYDAELDDPVKV
jgi:subtilase family serine protease